MTETADKSQHESNLSKGHTQIPNTIFSVLPLLTITMREKKVLELIIRLTFGCHKEWAYLNNADLRIVGISKSHAAGVISRLLNRHLVLKHGNSKIYKINEEYIASRVTKMVTPQLEKLGYLIGKQLHTSYYTGNPEVTEEGTLELPKEEQTGNQNGNSNRLPKWEHLASNNSEFSTPKDRDKDIKNNVKDMVNDTPINRGIHRGIEEY